MKDRERSKNDRGVKNQETQLKGEREKGSEIIQERERERDRKTERRESREKRMWVGLVKCFRTLTFERIFRYEDLSYSGQTWREFGVRNSET